MASVTISDLETILDRLHSLVNLNGEKEVIPQSRGVGVPSVALNREAKASPTHFSLPVLKATKVAPTPFKLGSIKREWKILPKK